jgi:hypothetical protein
MGYFANDDDDDFITLHKTYFTIFFLDEMVPLSSAIQ